MVLLKSKLNLENSVNPNRIGSTPQKPISFLDIHNTDLKH